MSDNDTPTWYDAEHDAQVAALECYADSVANDHGTDGDDAAHEHADGTLDVIYTWRARAIWSESQHVQECEDQLPDYGVDESADIDRRITLCVYIAIREAYATAWHELDAAHIKVTHAVTDYMGGTVHLIGNHDDCLALIGETNATADRVADMRIMRTATPAEIEQAIIGAGAETLGLRDAVTA